jgi:hypothetical protein
MDLPEISREVEDADRVLALSVISPQVRLSGSHRKDLAFHGEIIK